MDEREELVRKIYDSSIMLYLGAYDNDAIHSALSKLAKLSGSNASYVGAVQGIFLLLIQAMLRASVATACMKYADEGNVQADIDNVMCMPLEEVRNIEWLRNGILALYPAFLSKALELLQGDLCQNAAVYFINGTEQSVGHSAEDIMADIIAQMQRDSDG